MDDCHARYQYTADHTGPVSYTHLILLYRSQQKKGIDCLPEGKAELIFWEEILFFAVFLMWTYLAGFRPQAYGTEKFMDYGFMEAMMRSTTLPAKDLWYSEGTINYYYGCLLYTSEKESWGCVTDSDRPYFPE